MHQSGNNSPKSILSSWNRAESRFSRHRSEFKLAMSVEDKTEPRTSLTNFSEADQNRTYIEGLLQNLSAVLDRWIVTGSNGMVCFVCNFLLGFEFSLT